MRRLFVISSIPPKPTTGGEMLLHRHLSGTVFERQHWKTHVFCGEGDNLGKRCWRVYKKIASRIARTRWHRIARDMEVLEGGRWLDFELSKIQQVPAGSIVLTVAHGDLCEAAIRFALQHQLPLVTFFHDWWPDIPGVHRPFRGLLEKRFRCLYHQSDVAFCVSQGMKEHLGSHKKSLVLYPIPAPVRNRDAAKKVDKDQFKVKYFGNLFEYGPMLERALKEFQGQNAVRLEVRGSNPQWSKEFFQEMRDRKMWQDFAPRHELDKWLADADAFLVPMVFEPKMRRRMQTSFPSKLVEFAQLGKPLIVWGPKDCSAAQWVRDSEKALCIESDDTRELLFKISALAQNPAEQSRLALASRTAAANEFHPDIIQTQFSEALEEVSVVSKI